MDSAWPTMPAIEPAAGGTHAQRVISSDLGASRSADTPRLVPADVALRVPLHPDLEVPLRAEEHALRARAIVERQLVVAVATRGALCADRGRA